VNKYLCGRVECNKFWLNPPVEGLRRRRERGTWRAIGSMVHILRGREC